MWGTRCSCSLGGSGGRFIPTHVGNTVLPSTNPLSAPVHPHACGEHGSGGGVSGRGFGSSPRMWGTPPEDRPPDNGDRFIPTHVGNTSRSDTRRRDASVHPHACGEHAVKYGNNPAAIGSSPRMWGTPDRLLQPPPLRRFIPTHVGNTFDYGLDEKPCTVHPHACGEHVGAGWGRGVGVGSSPRMWGTLLHIPYPFRHGRFIPTHVGNTFTA